MAELMSSASTPWSSRQTVAQYRAIAWLRWRILVNGFRRKGGAGEIVGRIITIPLLAGVGLFPTIGAGFVAYYFAANGQLGHVSWLLWGAFILCQLLNINLGRQGTTFDPNDLIRFPVHLRGFVAIRLFFGLLAPANVLVSFISLAIAVGVGIALPSLWLAALVALAVFAAANVLFTRMVFAWVDRWLSTRRAREIFTVLIFTLSLGFQWANVNFNPAYDHHHHHRQALSAQRITVARHLYHQAHPLLACLPPELTGSALTAANQHRLLTYLGGVAGTALFAALFLGIFALRMRTEFRGEVLSDVANAVAPVRKSRSATVTARPSHYAQADVAPTHGPRSVAGVLLRKELLYVRRNVGLLYGLIVPVVMVFLFAGRMSSRTNSDWILPAAIAYTLFSVLPLSYNTFGLEGEGVQLYFLAPIRLRDVFIAKNLFGMLLALIEMAVVLAVIVYIGAHPSLEMIAITLLWAGAALLIGLTIGNLRSISAPKRIEFTRAAGKQASSLSALISMGVLLVLAAMGAGLFLAARLLHLTWVLLPVFAGLLALAFVVYSVALKRLEQYALDHREELFSVLSKHA